MRKFYCWIVAKSFWKTKTVQTEPLWAARNYSQQGSYHSTGGLCRNLPDVELQWSRVPALENTSKYKSILNIGTNFRNDLVISGTFVSRFHATFKVAKDGKCYLTDLGSKNGTKVNGVKIQPGKEIRVKKGDIVLCGDVDVTEQLPFPTPYPWIKWVAAVGVAAAVLLGAVWILGRKTVDPTKFRPAVVWVMAQLFITLLHLMMFCWAVGLTQFFVQRTASMPGLSVPIIFLKDIISSVIRQRHFLLTAKDVWELTDMLPILGTRLI